MFMDKRMAKAAVQGTGGAARIDKAADKGDGTKMNVKMLNLAVDLAGTVLCLMTILQLQISAVGAFRQKRFFLLFYVFLLLYVLSHMGGLLMKGLPGLKWHTGLQIANFSEFLFGMFLPYIFSRYLMVFWESMKQKKAVIHFWNTCLLLTLFLLILSQFTGVIYYIDEHNVYHRGPLYPLYYIGPFLIVISDIYFVIRFRDGLSHRTVAAILLYLIVPVAAAVFQVFLYGPALVIFSTLFSAFIMYVFLLTEQTEQYYRQEKEKVLLRLNLLSSQIKPHYIYNVLSSIHVLCRRNPEEAMRVVERFTEYLRANFEGIAAENAIAFQDELRHIKAYLEVEKCRYLEELEVEYHIEHTAFRIPALTVQPLVENAVKHGIGKEEVPLHITISARRCENASEIIVEDNGQGFDDPGMTRSGEALESIQERLKLMCRGTLTIISRKGVGTRAVIQIPDAADDSGVNR